MSMNPRHAKNWTFNIPEASVANTRSGDRLMWKTESGKTESGKTESGKTEHDHASPLR
jgi:hypothetical protein